MSAKVLTFKIKHRPNRLHAIRWLIANKISFPKKIAQHIGDELFHGWRFIQAQDGVVYFADCIHQGIDEDEFVEMMAAL